MLGAPRNTHVELLNHVVFNEIEAVGKYDSRIPLVRLTQLVYYPLAQRVIRSYADFKNNAKND